MVTRLVLVSNTAVSPVTTWSFWVTTTLPLASSRLIDEAPPGPGVADCIGADFADAAFAALSNWLPAAAAAELEFIKYHQCLRRHGGVALHHLHIAGESRFLFLVAHLKRGGFDLDRLVAVLRETLHRIGHAGHRALRAGFTGDRRERKTAALTPSAIRRYRVLRGRNQSS